MDADAVIDYDSLTPVYAQLAAILRARIDRGDWAAGRRILSESQLVQAYGLARGTVRKAIAALVEDGVLVAVPGRGTFVALAEDNDPAE
ncbi:GntR family transcriptional regulator [Glycomyces harbinensis]|uniref:GntR family transcriptional regulator n=1 Tax=Glycomyces harbinensis TaxID=58114 RepID=A0A1G6YTP0_9ACTN|nr:GntR family transcriptional regulator [Glycomyces harbinensis]SDD93874.1 GntR family transcriptional regulator [Glycomyces harbinensis]